VIRIELDDAKAPLSVANFLAYVAKGHYDGTVFHRVIKGFMVQGGGLEPGMKQKSTDAPIQNEANNGLKNNKYTLAMARTNAPALGHGAVLHQHRRQRLPQLPRRNAQGWGYAVFGKVVAGHRGGRCRSRSVRTGRKRLPRRRAAGRRGDPARR
jgi:peptidyl-prolyl cis-trans isomerase B (cyclophilin B)